MARSAVAHADQRVDLWDLALIRNRLNELGLADGLPDLFGDGTPQVDHNGVQVERIEVDGADFHGLRRLAISQTLREMWMTAAGIYRSRTLTMRTSCSNARQCGSDWSSQFSRRLTYGLPLRGGQISTKRPMCWPGLSLSIHGQETRQKPYGGAPGRDGSAG